MCTSPSATVTSSRPHPAPAKLELRSPGLVTVDHVIQLEPGAARGVLTEET